MKNTLIISIMLAALLAIITGTYAVADQETTKTQDSVQSWGEWEKMIPPAAQKAPVNSRDLQEQEWTVTPVDFQYDIRINFSGQTETGVVK